MKNNLVRGVRKASDFLMALQLTGAFKRGALPNLQARLPAVVIGGGLTGIDTATELFAYYPVQVEKMLERYETLVRRARRGGRSRDVRRRGARDARRVPRAWTRRPRRARARRRRPASAPDFVPLVRAWGGVTLAYRKRMVDSPAYRLNHEEIIKALEEGICVRREPRPARDRRRRAGSGAGDRLRGTERPRRAAGADRARRGRHVAEHHLREGAPGDVPARREEALLPGLSALSGTGDGVTLVPDPRGFFTSYNDGGRLISYYGDNHPAYAGNVVKAMASAKHGYRHVAALFADDRGFDAGTRRRARCRVGRAGRTRSIDELLARVEWVERLTPTIVEVVVRAPAAARHSSPGQFYRLQNFEALAPRAPCDRLRRC